MSKGTWDRSVSGIDLESREETFYPPCGPSPNPRFPKVPDLVGFLGRFRPEEVLREGGRETRRRRETVGDSFESGGGTEVRMCGQKGGLRLEELKTLAQPT